MKKIAALIALISCAPLAIAQNRSQTKISDIRQLSTDVFSLGALRLFSENSSPITSGGVGLWANGNSLYFRRSDGTDLVLSAPQLPSQSTHAGQFLETDGTNASWLAVTQDMILPGFAISGFGTSATSVLEIGQTISSPVTFTASYASPANSASIGDGTHTTTLSSPYTSGSLSFSYTSSTPNGTQTWTLTAIAATTKTATVSTIWESRIYSGIATPGAIDSAFVNALPTSQLAAGVARNYSIGVGGNTMKAYLCLAASLGQPTSFKDGGGFAVPTSLVASSVSVTNSYSVTTAYNCYASDNLLNSAFSWVVQ